MKGFLKGKVVTIAVVIATFVLAGIAIFTALRLYKLRQQAVAPTSPESKPSAQEVSTLPDTLPAQDSTRILVFTIEEVIAATPTPSPTPPPVGGPATSPTPTPTASPSPTPTPSPSPIAQASPSPTAEPALPPAGIGFPTVLGVGAGLALIIITLLLAL